MSDRDSPAEAGTEEKDEEHEDAPGEEARGREGEPPSPSPSEDTLGITESQMTAYSLVLSLGNITKGDLVLLLRNQGLHDVDSLVQSLIEKEMLVELPGVVTRYQAVPPFDELAKEVGQISERMDSLRRELKQQILTASKQVRDALLGLSSQKLEAVRQEQDLIQDSKANAVNALDKSITDLQRDQESLENQFGSDMGETASAWAERTTKIVSSEIGESRESASTLKTEVEHELSGASSDIEDQLKTLNSELGTSFSDMTSRAVSDIENQKQELNAALDSSSSSISSRLSSNEKKTIQRLTEMQKATETSLQDISERINTGIEKVEADVGHSVDAAVTMVSQQYDALEEELTGALDSYVTQEEEILNEHSATLDDSFMEFVSTKNEAVSTLKSALNDAMSEYSSSAETSVTSMSEQVEDMAARGKSAVDSASESMHRYASKAIQELYDRADEYATGARDRINEELVQKKQQLTDTLQSTGSALNAISRESLDMTTGLLDTYRADISQQLRQVMEYTADELQNLSQEATADLDVLLNTVRDETSKIISRAKSQTEAMSSRASQQIADALTAHIANLDSNLTERIEASRSKHDLMTKKIDETVLREVTETSDTLQGLLDRICTELDDLVADIDSSRRSELGVLESNLGDQRRMAQESVDQASTETRELVGLLHTGLEDSMQKMQNAGSAASNSFDSATERLRVKHTTAKEELVQSTRSSLGSEMESLTNRIQTLAASGRSEVREKAGVGMETFSESVKSLQEESSSEFSGNLEEMDSIIGGASEEINRIFAESRTEVSTVLKEAGDGIASCLSGASSSLSENKRNAQSRLDEGISTALQGAESRLESTKLMTDSTVGSLVKKMSSTEEKLTSSISAAANELSSESMAALAKSLERSSAALDGATARTKEAIKKGYDNLIGHAASTEDILSDTVNKLEKSTMIGLTEETVDAAFAASAETQIDTGRVAEALSNMWERLGSTDFPGARNTWNVVTREAVVAHMRDMLSRAKSKVTLIVPDAQDIPTDTLKELKSTVGVELVVTESPALSRQAKPLVGRGNIRVRSRSEKDVYACVRDSEEVLLAPATPEGRDVIGFVSEDDGFVRFVMSIVGPIFQARTTML
ncbi:hypothetical protein EU546_06825, partial [Candidatus Thorarchaeota archaeon]